ncbi:MAG: hypothetical protein H7232_02945 [Aeromicrobium sp.]|nr:hypothetical protein [Burkholderiales bacterium]
MIIDIQLLDKSRKVICKQIADMDALKLMVVSEKAEALVLKLGAEKSRQFIAVSCIELGEAIQDQLPEEVVSARVCNAVMFTWLYESIYCGLTADTFITSDLKFRIFADGGAEYGRESAANVQ